MKLHNWYIEEIDGGYLGIGYFWKCNDCQASGGPCFPNNKLPRVSNWPIFLAGEDLEFYLPEDCEESKRLIDNYYQGDKYKEKLAQREKWDKRRARALRFKNNK